MEYKAERAGVPTKKILEKFKSTYVMIKNNCPLFANAMLENAVIWSVDQREVDEIKSVYDLLDSPQEAMERIADILTQGGRIYDEFSGFLRKEKAIEKSRVA